MRESLFERSVNNNPSEYRIMNYHNYTFSVTCLPVYIESLMCLILTFICNALFAQVFPHTGYVRTCNRFPPINLPVRHRILES